MSKPLPMKFTFRLAPIKRLREHEEKRARGRLMQEIKRLGELEQSLHDLDLRMLSVNEKFGLVGGVVGLRASSEHYGRLIIERATLSGLITLQQGAVEEARAIHRAVRIKLRSLERLEERARESHRQAELVKEQRFLDELAIRRVSV